MSLQQTLKNVNVNLLSKTDVSFFSPLWGFVHALILLLNQLTVAVGFFFPVEMIFSLSYFHITNLNSMMSTDEFEACFSDVQYIHLLFFSYKWCC